MEASRSMKAVTMPFRKAHFAWARSAMTGPMVSQVRVDIRISRRAMAQRRTYSGVQSRSEGSWLMEIVTP